MNENTEENDDLELPWYFTVNGRPIMMVATPDGGMDVLAFNWKDGTFERDLDYLTRCLVPEGDVEQLTKLEFDVLVEQLLQEL